MPSECPSVARGMAVGVILLSLYLLPTSFAEAQRQVRSRAAPAQPLCLAPIEVDKGDGAHLACADEPALAACQAESLDAVRLRSDGTCHRDPGGLRAEWRIATGHPLDVNRASQVDLRLVPTLSRSQAAALVKYRAEHGPFTALSDLRAVPGIGGSTVRNLAPWLAVML